MATFEGTAPLVSVPHHQVPGQLHPRWVLRAAYAVAAAATCVGVGIPADWPTAFAWLWIGAIVWRLGGTVAQSSRLRA